MQNVPVETAWLQAIKRIVREQPTRPLLRPPVQLAYDLLVHKERAETSGARTGLRVRQFADTPHYSCGRT